MKKKYLAKKLGVVAVLGLAIVLQSTDAFARERHREGDRGRSREVVKVVNQSYVHQSRRSFDPAWFWFNLVFPRPSIGAVVTILPHGHSRVVIGGSTYYHSNNTYYRACPYGYMVVPAPVVNQHVAARHDYSGGRCR